VADSFRVTTPARDDDPVYVVLPKGRLQSGRYVVILRAVDGSQAANRSTVILLSYLNHQILNRNRGARVMPRFAYHATAMGVGARFIRIDPPDLGNRQPLPNADHVIPTQGPVCSDHRRIIGIHSRTVRLSNQRTEAADAGFGRQGVHADIEPVPDFSAT